MIKIDWDNGRASDGSDAECKKIIITGDWVPCWDIARGSYYDRIMAEHPAECYGETLDVLKAALTKCVPAKKQHLLEPNLRALQLGYDY